MPTPPPENKNKPQPFSVDDMMDRLKARPEEGSSSRVVTREVIDGQMVEVVRKRRRRTHQPKKEKERRHNLMKRLLLWVGLPALLLFVALVIVTIFRYQSDAFRSALSDRVSELLGVRTEFRRLQVKGLSSAATTSVLVTGREGSLLKEAELGTLKADLTVSSFFSRNWIVNALMIQSGSIVLHPPAAAAGAWNAPARPDLLMAGLGLSPKPEGIELAVVRVTSCDLLWDSEIGDAPPKTLVDSALVSTTNFGPNPLLAIRGGRIRLPHWPEMDIDKGEITLGADGAEIRDMTLDRRNFGDAEGSARMSGTVALTAGGLANVTVDLKSMELRGLVPEHWVSKIRGAVTSQLQFQSALGRSGSLQAEGKFSVENAVLGDLSSLKKLATYVGEARLTRLEFDTLGGHYRRTPLGVEITELTGEVEGILRVRGAFAIGATGAISGQLDVGLPEVLLARRAEGIPAFFGPAEDGYCWAKTTLKGRNNEPEDDLTTRFEQEAAQRKLRTAPLVPEAGQLPPDAAAGRPPIPADPSAATGREKLLEDTFDALIGE